MDSQIVVCRACGSRLFARGSACLTCRALIRKDLGYDWTQDAVCAQIDPDLWYPEDGQNVSTLVDRTCASCPVRRECLLAGLHETHGVWAGYRPKDREQLRKRLWNAKPETRNAVLAKAATYGRQLFLRIKETE